MKNKIADCLNDRYQVLAPIAEGGFSYTFLVKDKQCYGKKHVVKVPNYSCDLFGEAIKKGKNKFLAKKDEIYEIFEREAQFMIAASNSAGFDGIPKIKEFIYTENPQLLEKYTTVSGDLYRLEEEETKAPHIVMKYIEGITLTQKIAQSIMTPLETIALAKIILNLFIILHKSREDAYDSSTYYYILQDLKADNILVSSTGNYYIIDFGSIVRYEEEEELILSLPMISVGYAAPEVFQGEDPIQREIDCRFDIYTLGVLMFFCLTGISPLDEKVFDSHSFTHDLSKINCIFPKLADIINRATENNRENRYFSAQEMLGELNLVDC